MPLPDSQSPLSSYSTAKYTSSLLIGLSVKAPLPPPEAALCCLASSRCSGTIIPLFTELPSKYEIDCGVRKECDTAVKPQNRQDLQAVVPPVGRVLTETEACGPEEGQDKKASAEAQCSVWCLSTSATNTAAMLSAQVPILVQCTASTGKRTSTPAWQFSPSRQLAWRRTATRGSQRLHETAAHYSGCL